jgi:DNA-binding transcriptional ArsR family regulator
MPLRAERLDIFQLVADPTRRALIELLDDGEHAVQELADAVGVSISAVSQQLKVLKTTGLVRVRPDGRRRLYRLDAGPIEAMAAWANARCERFWQDKLAGLDAHLAKGRTDR